MATFVLIHGGGSSAWDWHLLVPELVDRGHDVVVPELPVEDRSAGFAEDKPWPLDAWPDVPTKVLIARDDQFFPADFQRRVAADRLGIVPDEIDGGHLVALSRPEELADRLNAYLLH